MVRARPGHRGLSAGRPWRTTASTRFTGRPRVASEGMGSVLSLNLADVRTIERRGKPVKTGIWKLPAVGRVHTGREGLDCDVQADRRVHGGADMAVYSYAREDIDWWETELGRPLEDGTFGENLTSAGSTWATPEWASAGAWERCCSRSPLPASPAGSWASEWMIRASSSASPARCGRVPTCGWSRRESSGRATRWRSWSGRTTP